MKNLAKLFADLENDRQRYVDRAVACAQVTIPQAFPDPKITDRTEDLTVPWQSVGADGLSSLSAKLKQVLFPSNLPFFRLALSQSTLEDIRQGLEEQSAGDTDAYRQGLDAILEDTDNIFSLYEQEAVKLMEARGDGPKQYQVFLQLLLAGNVLIKDTRVSREFSVCRLDSYVALRDDTGKLLKCVLREDMHKDTILSLPSVSKDLRAKLEDFFGKPENEHRATYSVYTGQILQSNGKYKVTQEISSEISMTDETRVELSEATFDSDDLPLRPLRLYDSPGESYSRSYVDQFLGDLKTLDGIYQAIAEGAAAASRFIWLVSPNSQTDPDDLNNAKNGDAITGVPGDVTPLSAEGKVRDLQAAYQLADRLESRIGKAFLLTSSLQRDAERVTATEIAQLIRELETQLGGIYSILSQEFQRPYVWFLLSALKSLPKLPKDAVESAIITGQDALGRTEELQRLDQFLGRVGQFGPEALQYIQIGEVLQRTGRSLGVPQLSAIMKSEDQVQQERQAAMEAQQQAEIQRQVAGPVAKAQVEAAQQQP